MSLLAALNNTTLRVYREDRSEPYEPPTRVLVGRWAAHLRLGEGYGSGSVEEAGGVQSRSVQRCIATLSPDAADVLDDRCEVEDSRGTRYAVESVASPLGLGLDRCRVVLRRVEGVA